jgi:uncharacterized Zn finger protein (UPF0148 family)
MATQTCSSCGEELPEELGQHALVPSAGVVACPHCGATVTLEKAEAGSGSPGDEQEESFSGHETLEGVMQEIEEKDQ